MSSKSCRRRKQIHEAQEAGKLKKTVRRADMRKRDSTHRSTHIHRVKHIPQRSGAFPDHGSLARPQRPDDGSKALQPRGDAQGQPAAPAEPAGAAPPGWPATSVTVAGTGPGAATAVRPARGRRSRCRLQRAGFAASFGPIAALYRPMAVSTKLRRPYGYPRMGVCP